MLAAAALATYDSDNPLWDDYKIDVVAKLVSLNPDFLKPWKDAFRPVSNTLIDPLSNILRTHEHDEIQRSLATSLLAAPELQIHITQCRARIVPKKVSHGRIVELRRSPFQIISSVRTVKAKIVMMISGKSRSISFKRNLLRIS